MAKSDMKEDMKADKKQDVSLIKKAFKPCTGCKSKAACTKMGKCLAKK